MVWSMSSNGRTRVEHVSEQESPFYTVAEVARRHHQSKTTVLRKCHAGDYPGAFKPGPRSWLIPRESVR